MTRTGRTAASALPFMFLLLTAACAVLDVSTLDTAVPLAPGKVRFGLQSTSGVDLSTFRPEEDYEGQDPGFENQEPQTQGTYTSWLSYGIDGTNEVTGKMWLSIASGGAKVYVKHLIHQQDKMYVSVAPGATFVYSLLEDDESEPRFSALGAELQVLATRKYSSNTSFTLAARGNFNRYQSTVVNGINGEEDYGPYNLINYGVRGNLELKLGPIILMPELGVEFVPRENDVPAVLPNAGIALGLEL
jgi:hypothetical protein